MKSSVLAPVALFAASAAAQSGAYGQCGGMDWKGATTCVSGYTCTYSNPYYSQCLPGTGGGNGGTTTTTIRTTTTTAGGSTPTSGNGGGSGKVRFAGVNIAGFDFGCTTNGACNLANIYASPTAADQMKHFYIDDNLNTFRLPVGWQFLVNNNLGGTLDSTNLAKYDQQMQACLNTGAYCIIDIHNYARWNGGIIGQGGPTNAQFASVWSQLAAKYKGQSRIMFGLMNEPHDVPSIQTWADSVQAAVTAIRQAGATSQMILLPGNDWTSAQQFVPNGSLDALKKVTNLDGSTTNLIFDVHKYLDSDNSGTHTECVTDNVQSAFAPLASALRAINRQAIVSETGGGNTASCAKYMCQQLAYINANSDVYLGYTTWAAGGFDYTYELTETPTYSGGKWVDTSLVQACIRR